MSTLDRHAHGYEPRFDIDGPYGHQGELWYLTVLDAMTTGSVEVKTDDVFGRTGNLYVEYEADKGARGLYEPSGIAITEADFWAFKLGPSPACLVMSTDLLRAFVATPGIRTASCVRGSCPTNGYLLPFRYLIQAAAEAGER